MKIVYAAGNRVGADIQLSDFINHTTHEVMVAAYFEYSQSLQYVDWTLDALTNKKASKLGLQKTYNRLRSDIEEFGPDLIICDYEPFVSDVANYLNVPLWYISPLHLIDGVVWERGQLQYTTAIEDARRILNKLPPPTECFVYSPFGDVKMRPSLRDGFGWIQPHHLPVDRHPDGLISAILPLHNDRGKLLPILTCASFEPTIFNGNEDSQEYESLLSRSEWIVMAGATRTISDAIYNNIGICTVPKTSDAEQALNAILSSTYKIGTDLGQLELLEKFALERLETAFSERRSLNTNYLDIQSETLHERLDDGNNSGI